MREKAGEAKSFDPVPTGETLGICNTVIDLGEEYWEKFNKWQDKILIGFELPEHIAEYEENGVQVKRPRTLSRRFKKELFNGKGEKSEFHKFLTKWIGRELKVDEEGYTLFKPEMLIGLNGNVDVEHVTKAKTFAEIECVRPLRSGQEKVKATLPSQVFLLERLAEGENPWDAFPKDVMEWVTRAFAASRQGQAAGPPPQASQAQASASATTAPAADDDDDDFPF
jgi:hypothetical protein